MPEQVRDELGAITPIPVPQNAREIALFGGTFDPPHRAHAELAAAARDLAAPGAWLVFVPAARSPFKEDAPSADEHRLAMLRLATTAVERGAIWTDELDRAGRGEPSYWIDTLRRAGAARPDAKLRFLIGSDQAAEFHRWREPGAILEIARPIVLPRAPVTTPEELGATLRETGAWSQAQIAAWRGAMVALPAVDSSATRARALLRAGRLDDPSLSELVDPAVLEYIHAHGLYLETIP